MSTKNERTAGTLVLQIALGLLFVVGGIWTLQNGNGDEISRAIRHIFNSDVSKVLCIVFGIIEIVAGVFLILRLFANIATNLDSLLMIIIMICWIVCIILIDFISDSGIINNLNSGFLPWTYRFAGHLLVLGAILKVKN